MKILSSPFQNISFKPVFLLGILWLGALASSATMVFLKHRMRCLHAHIQALEKKRFALNVEWSQLVLEKETWCSKIRVEALARNQLGLLDPKSQQIRILKP